jgi:hypothetical protein
LLRSLVIIGLALALTVIAILAVVGYLPQVWGSFEPLSSTSSKVVRTIGALIAFFVVFLPLGSIVVLVRKRWLTWKVLAAGWVVVLPVLGWLAWDEPAIRQPLTIEEFSPAFPGAEQSYAVLMQYSKLTPSVEAKAFAAFKPAVQFSGASPDKPAKWLEWVAQNRPALGTDWTALAPQRRWLAEVAAFDRLGDVTPSDYNANIVTFQVWRTLSQRTCAQATLQALDGQGDEAIATLVPLLEVSRKLQLSSRSLVRTMVAVFVERLTLETAGIVLDHTPVSAASRARLAAALANENAPALARRLLLVEYVVFAPNTMRVKLGDNLAATRGSNFILRRPLNFLSALFFNPVATTNVYGDRIRELADLAETRELGKFSVRCQDFGNIAWRQAGMKNVGGRLMLSMAVPSFDKVLASHWKTADLRAALRQRVAGAN